MDITDVAADRRAAAPHPGPLVRREYLDVLGVSVGELADQIGIDASRLDAMLAGRLSIDVDAAIRIARALQLPAERIMRLQLQCDFAAVRRSGAGDAVPVLRAPRPQTFPDVFIRGKLGCATDDARAEASYFFQQSVARPVAGDAYAGLHALWRGDRLRVYDEAGGVLWLGPVLHDLDGRVLLPFKPEAEWHAWFVAGLAADLAFGDEHAAFFARMNER